MLRFEHESLPQRVCFASGQAAAMLAGEIQRLGASRVMVLASQSEAERSEQLTADLPVVVHHNEIAMHVPSRWPSEPAPLRPATRSMP